MLLISAILFVPILSPVSPPILFTIQSKSLIIAILGQLQLWTKNLYKSSLHRVRNRSGKDRYSVPFFFNGNLKCVLDPLDGSKGEGITVEGLLSEFLFFFLLFFVFGGGDAEEDGISVDDRKIEKRRLMKCRRENFQDVWNKERKNSRYLPVDREEFFFLQELNKI